MEDRSVSLLIGGPTSSGKSTVCLALAERFGGEVVSLDSVQIYQGLSIGSGVITPEEMRGIPHHLLGVYPPSQFLDAPKVVHAASVTIDEVRSRGHLPIISAGSTLHCTMLLHGIAPVPEASRDLREEWMQRPPELLWQQLVQEDPEAASSIGKNDRPRIERALEVKLTTGKSIREIQATHQYPPPEKSFVLVSLWWNRQKLYSRINARCQRMIDAGLLAEAKVLKEKFGESAPALRSIGYPEMLSVVNQAMSLEAAQEKFEQSTRQFAKRQMTYWKNEPIKRGWAVSPQSGESSTVLLGGEVLRQKGPRSRGAIVYQWSIDQLQDNLSLLFQHVTPGVRLFNLDAEFLLSSIDVRGSDKR